MCKVHLFINADNDYLMSQGHELTLRVLYRLFGEAEEEPDFFSSTTAASVYENFLLTVVCAPFFLILLSICKA